MKIYHFDDIPSTNDFAMTLKDKGEDAVITARSQSDGHGTKGRAFLSQKGGLYLTKLTFYPDFPSKNAFRIMIDACVAVCRTLEYFSLHPSIKWPNDVLVGGKKICGTLINNTFSGDKITCSVVGIGLNIENAFEGELKDIATNMAENGAVGATYERVREELIKNLSYGATVQEYKKYIKFIGREILLVSGENRHRAIARGVDDFGRLIVEEDGKVFPVSSAEVSLRFA